MLSLLLALGLQASLQDLDVLDRQIADFTLAPIGEEGGALQPLDRRLKLRDCNRQVQISWRSDERDTVMVKCPDAGGWRLYVPVTATQVSASEEQLAQSAVRRGDAVSIAVSGPGFSVSRPGEALDDGAVGDWIKVRPATATRRRSGVVRARIVRAGVVTLDMN